MSVEELWLTTPAGLRLFYRRWSASPVRAVVVVVHGFGEHGGRYDILAERLGRDGAALYAVDHRGHGRSPGRRGHVGSWGEYRDDLGTFLALVRAEQRGLPLFLFGQSMGALIAVDYALHHPEGLRGVIASAIGLKPGKIARRDQIFLVRMLSKVAPMLPLAVGGLDGTRLTRVAREAEAYRTDPLVHAEATLAWGREALGAVERVRRMAPSLSVPALVTHGGADTVVLPEGSRELYEAIGHPDKELKIYDGAYHEPHNDECRHEVLEDLASWIGARVDDGSPR